METHIDINEFIPISFRNHFYASTGRTRKYPLQAFLWALIIQRIFSIPTDQLLLTFLTYSKPLREFCGFTKVPDASKITRFKQDFLDDLQLVFDKLVDVHFTFQLGISKEALKQLKDILVGRVPDRTQINVG